MVLGTLVQFVLEYVQIIGGGHRDDVVQGVPGRVEDLLVKVQTIYTDHHPFCASHLCTLCAASGQSAACCSPGTPRGSRPGGSLCQTSGRSCCRSRSSQHCGGTGGGGGGMLSRVGDSSI